MNIFLAQIIINSYSFGTAAAPGGAGFILQESGSYLLQQDAVSKLKKESSSGFLIQEDGTFLLQQDASSKLKQE